MAPGGVAIWFTGLPGCGKSTLAQALVERLRRAPPPALAGREVAYLSMDERRKAYVPHPEYTEAERDRAYLMFVEEAAALARAGQVVVLDGTAHSRAWRDRARALVPCFVEVYVRCPLDVAMAREASRPEGEVMAGLYAKALERQRTGRDFPGLGQVIGVDVPFEENPDAEVVLDAERVPPEAAAERVAARLAALL